MQHQTDITRDYDATLEIRQTLKRRLRIAHIDAYIVITQR